MERSLSADVVDYIFAVIYLMVGFLFIYIFSSEGFDRKIAGFTVFYVVVVLTYLRCKKIRPSKESYFWLAVLLALGLPMMFWNVLGILQVLALICTAAYWTLSASGRLIEKRTSGFVFFDGWNALAAVPFLNFTCQLRVLLGKDNRENINETKGHQMLTVALGIVLAIPALLIILPLLSSADAGFEYMAGNIVEYIQQHLIVTLIRMVFAIPVAAYLYGLAFGGIHGRNTERLRKERIQEAGRELRRIPETALCTAMTVICLVYVIFIWMQGGYLFSAFRGFYPYGYTYSQYARRGFFELCQISAWNLVLLGGTAVFSRRRIQEHKGLKIVSIVLSILTLLLIVTAMSKLGMYIDIYGLTVNRILPMVFMIWLAVVFVVVMLRQSKDFPAARFCIMAGAVLFCMLCVFPVEAWAEAYNVWARARGMIV